MEGFGISDVLAAEEAEEVEGREDRDESKVDAPEEVGVVRVVFRARAGRGDSVRAPQLERRESFLVGASGGCGGRGDRGCGVGG